MTRKPQQAWEHPDQSAVREPTAIVLDEFAAECHNIACRDMNLPRPSQAHAAAGCASLERCLNRSEAALTQWNVCPETDRGNCRRGLGGSTHAAQRKGSVALGCPIWEIRAPRAVHPSRGGTGAGSVRHVIGLDEHPYCRCVIIKLKTFCNTRFRW